MNVPNDPKLSEPWAQLETFCVDMNKLHPEGQVFILQITDTAKMRFLINQGICKQPRINPKSTLKGKAKHRTQNTASYYGRTLRQVIGMICATQPRVPYEIRIVTRELRDDKATKKGLYLYNRRGELLGVYCE